MDLQRFLAWAFILLAGIPALFAQTAPATYWVQFTNKDHTPYSLSEPSAYLSPRTIERRARQGIAIDSLDLPVDPAYIAQLRAAGQIELLNVSKWFNAVTIRSTDTLALDSLDLLPFVHQVRITRDNQPRPALHADKLELPLAARSFADDYGRSFRQVEMMNGHLLHEVGGAKGRGMLIGVLDSGYEDADILPGLADLRERHGIVLARDLVEPGGNVYAAHYHGRSVLSVMAGYMADQLQGTAPLADYVLVRTEDVTSEYPVEEDNWVSGAELCDSIGCDVLNTSLGYTTFDDSTLNHTYADLNGLTSRMTMAADIAVRKGMLVVNSAGNSGAQPWHYISVPADAFDILAVGAVDTARQVVNFSSRGPSADGRVKPDVAAMGLNTIGLDGAGWNVGPINGTSFSAPLVAGLSACLWQLHRDRTAHEIMAAIRQSASHHGRPNDSIGYGIPDYWRAHLLLGGRDLTSLDGPTAVGILPVPFTDFMDVEVFAGNEDHASVEIHDVLGRIVWKTRASLEPGTFTRLRLEDGALRNLRSGAYIVAVGVGGSWITKKVVKAQ